ncbi:hypothetical protein A9993_07855 [Rahnella victoriana]|uniref:hypothetical protein n=1 Tax=Rahnella victoriana TaxID=1510570 RepID=UPI000BB1B777|nr:hypothetical protein [Rahnella victoriana]PBI79659.1 hypothetical protein A9993_07855 [Rahnella victoriana]
MKYEITKGSEKDFEGAPEWATMKCHCTVGDPSKITNMNVAFSDGVVRGSRWVSTFEDGLEGVIDREEQWHIIAERRPITEPFWDGEGLPPVGLPVEYKLANRNYRSDFSKGTVLFYGEQNWLIKHWSSGNEFLEPVGGIDFRPIRSPEDVARDESIEAMCDVGYTLPAAIRFTKEEMAALYDAGYRRPKPHADEVQECEHNSTRPTSGGCICNDCGWTSW